MPRQILLATQRLGGGCGRVEGAFRAKVSPTGLRVL